jgi:ABC-type bacteriocin/lantibiotic exporter with double-glycine peptidase domain
MLLTIAPAQYSFLLQATGSRIGIILQATSTLTIGIILAFTYSWKMTLVSLVSVPVIFAGIFLESKVIRGEGLKEKTALEAATKVTLISNSIPSIQFS